jgi:hypothetical protein
MFKFSIRGVIVVGLILVLVSIPVVSHGASLPEPRTPTLNGLHWTKNPTVQYTIMSGDYKTQAVQAIDDVNKTFQTYSKFKLVKGTQILTATPSVPEGSIAIATSFMGSVGWVGLTTPYRYSNSPSVFHSATIKINTYEWSEKGCMYNKGVNGIQSVVAHELCHALGIDHNFRIPMTASAYDKYCIIYPSVACYTQHNVYLVDTYTKKAFDKCYNK